MQDTSKIKERIISILNSEGPNFPSPIASKIQTSILFTSAFLSELLSEKRLKITNMKVGSSPIYYLENQKEKLEPFATKYLKSKEKDAFILLQDKKILKDKNQEPAIRVALRQIKDFAIPLEKDNELYWNYFLNKNETPEEKNETKEEPEKTDEEKSKDEVSENNKDKQNLTVPSREELPDSSIEKKSLEIFDKEKNKKPEPEKPKHSKKKATKKTPKKKTAKVNEKFFNKVKEYLSENQIEISDIVSFSKNDITLKVKNLNSSEEYLLVAYNKKTIREDDIVKASKKAEEENLKYEILSLGEPLKKVSAFIEAIQKIKGIKKIN